MDAPAGRGHTRGLRRACTASTVRRVGTADRDSVGRVSRAGCIFDAKARPCILALKYRISSPGSKALPSVTGAPGGALTEQLQSPE